MKKTAIAHYSLWCLLASLFFSIGAFGQASDQDCFSAIPVCTNTYTNPLSYSGSGNVANEIGSSSCLGAGELNSVWYIVTVQNSGNLAFGINPVNPNEDYDWAVFNLTSAACTDIATDPTLEVSCNFSGVTFPTGLTGPNGGSEPQEEPVIPVLAGETYVVCISNFSSSQNGYTLDFSASTASIIDVTPPGVIGVSLPIACGSNQLTFSFSESVLCNTVQASDFNLIDPNGTSINITSVIGAACAANGTFESTFTFTFGSPLTISGQYHLNLVGSVTDNCGNSALPADFPFDINAVITNVIATDEFCGHQDGQIEVQANGGTPPYTYTWDDPQGQTTPIASNLNDGTYTCTITDANSCQAVIHATINDPLYFTITTSAINDLCTAHTGSVSVQTNGGTGNFQYQWDDMNLQTTPTAINLGAGIYTIVVNDANNQTCQQTAQATIFDFNDVTAGFTVSPTEVSYLDPVASFKNTSINAITFDWDFGDNSPGTISENTTHTFPTTPGFYNVRLAVTSPSGCVDTLIIPVRVTYDLNFYVPNAFTPNGDLVNEEFKVYSDGINYNDFEMVICDRWGGKVFYTTNPFESWNGAKDNEGEILPDGIYVYRVRFTQLYDNIEHKYLGKVALIR